MRKARGFFCLLLFFILIPAVMVIGVFALGDRQYYFVSLLIMGCAGAAFLARFEKRRPQARELVVMAVMAALAVAGRAVFAPLPQVKPALAVVFLTGVALGPEAGFLTGATSGLVSNFFFGQGPWTPWQMFAFGTAGFLAGILFAEGRLPRRRGLLALLGGLCALVVYGGLVNISSVLLYMPRLTPQALIAAYLAGGPFDLIHAISTAAFLFFLSNPILEKLTRIQTKYGLLKE